MEQAKCYVLDLRQLRKDVRRKTLSKGTIVKCVGITAVLLVALPATALAAETGIDAGAEKIYHKLIRIGKWVIIGKGGIDTIKSVAEGDMAATKKNFLSYGLTYGMLWALPWMLKEIEKLFEGTEQ